MRPREGDTIVRYRHWLLSSLVLSGTILAAACAPATTTTSTLAGATPARAVAVNAGMQIGNTPPAPAGWAPPAKVTPVDPVPGMFKSVGDAPPQPAPKVRVFFLGMQW
jgi:hypothetical protein